MIILYTALQCNDTQPSICNTQTLFIRSQAPTKWWSQRLLCYLLFTPHNHLATFQIFLFVVIVKYWTFELARHATDIHSVYHTILPGKLSHQNIKQFIEWFITYFQVTLHSLCTGYLSSSATNINCFGSISF